MPYTVTISDPSLAPAYGTDVRHFRTQADVLHAWEAAYYNDRDCSALWGGDLPAMSDELTITVWAGTHDDVTDMHPCAEVTRGRQRRPVWRRVF